MRRGEQGWVVYDGRAVEATCARGKKPTLWTVPGVDYPVAAYLYASRAAAEAAALLRREGAWQARAMRDFHRQDADALRATLAAAAAEGVPLRGTRATIEAALRAREAEIAALRAALAGA